MDEEHELIRIPVTDVLDLHSIPARDAKAVVEEYLAEAHRLGLRALRIIHGRGIGVQREMVRKILARTEYVESFADAPPEAGGWGATVLTLRGKSIEPRS
jgi:DNA-nicking Smr family endonuclease